MSFALPKNVPSFDSTQRPYENTFWRPAGSSYHDGHTNSGIGKTLGKLFESKDGLPMYKDKPHAYQASRRSRGLFRRKRTWLGAILGCLGTLYVFGVFSTSSPLEGASHGQRKSQAAWWSWMNPTSGNDDELWESRREKVKEAFTLSWDGYSQSAWGMSVRSPYARGQEYVACSAN